MAGLTGTTRFIPVNSNYATSTLASVHTAPAGLPGFPSSNLLNADRFRIYACPPEPVEGSDTTVIIALGGTRQVYGVGLAKYSGNPQLMSVYYGTDPSTPTFLGLFIANYVDGLMYEATTSFAASYIRFVHSQNSSGFTLSRYVVCARPSDLGVTFSPGSSRTRVQQRTETRTCIGTPVFNRTGSNRYRWALQWNDVPLTLAENIASYLSGGSTLFIDLNGALFEVDLVGNELTVTYGFGSASSALTASVSALVEQIP